MLMLSMRCPVCQGNFFSQGAQIFDDRYGEPNLYRLSSCTTCGHFATFPRLPESALPNLYGHYYPRKNIKPAHIVFEARKVNRTFANFIRWWNGSDNQGQYSVLPGEKMLDVGCGTGSSLLEARFLGAIASGVEADLNLRPIATTLGLSIHFGSLSDRPFPGQFFDLIVLNQVIEHLPDPDIALQVLSERLAPGGRIGLGFPNRSSFWQRICGHRWINWHTPYHLHHFNYHTFRRMARFCGLEVTSSRTITPNVWTILQVRALFDRVKRGQPSAIWSTVDHSNLTHADSPKRKILRRFLLFAISPVLFLVNRTLDTLGIGDSLMIELRKNIC